MFMETFSVKRYKFNYDSLSLFFFFFFSNREISTIRLINDFMKFHERKSSFFFVHKKERVFVLSTEYKNRKQNDKENTFPIKMSSYTQCFPFRVIKYTYSMYSSIASKLQLITAIAIKTIDSNPNRCSSNANFRSRDRQWEKRTRGRVEIESQR